MLLHWPAVYTWQWHHRYVQSIRTCLYNIAVVCCKRLGACLISHCLQLVCSNILGGRLRRVTLNNASDYRTSGLYRTPNPKKVKVNICYSAPNRLSHCRGAQVHGAHQAASHIPALNLPSRSRYSFTDHLRMEGWVSPGPGCKEQLAHGCYATARSSGALTRISRSKVEHTNH